MEWKTTFWSDFSIADKFGKEAIKDTFNRAFNEWKDNYIYLTELVIVLNWKCWDFYELNNIDISRLYHDLYYEARNYALDHLEGEQLSYYLEATD